MESGIKIQIGKSQFAIVDREDFESLSKWKWHLTPNGYARRHQSIGGSLTRIYMHRHILGKDAKRIDHVNGVKLDNRKSNLRKCSVAENGFNQKIHRNNTSGYKGIRKSGSKWQAQIQKHGKNKCIGTFPTKQLAAKAYDSAAMMLHGKFRKTNLMLGLL